MVGNVQILSPTFHMHINKGTTESCLLTMKFSLGNTLKRMTKNIDDKINNNNDTSHDNKTSCDDGKKSVTDPNCGHVEPFGAESDTGTYTVENDEDGDDLRKEGEGVTSPSECRKEVVGLKNQEVEKGSSEWVSVWASKTTSMEVKGVSGIELC